MSVTQISSLLENETNQIANFSNIAAVLKENHAFFWVGFYMAEDKELVLGPFQGPVACTRIKYGKGVCGTSWMKKQLLNVQDVHKFPGHIACNEKSKSEIVLPVVDKSGKVLAVLDIDSEHIKNFDQTDEKFLSEICDIITRIHG